MEIDSPADLVEEVTPYAGQDCQLVYRVRTDRTMSSDQDISSWNLRWVLCLGTAGYPVVLSKTTADGITVATPRATVTLLAAETAALAVGTVYRMQLWRTDSWFTYPVTGLGTLIPQAAPSLG